MISDEQPIVHCAVYNGDVKKGKNATRNAGN
jgi:hypothetical protein